MVGVWGGGIITPTPFEGGGGQINKWTLDFPIKAAMSNTACWQKGLPLD